MQTNTNVQRTKRQNPEGASASATPPEPGTAPPARILVVDDDESVRFLNALLLQRAGYEVDCATDGQSAWEILSGGHYDLVVTDHEMPRLSGLELVERMHTQHLEVPVIIVSGSFEAIDHNEPGLNLAAVLRKPFHLSELVVLVGQTLALSPGRQHSDFSDPAISRPATVYLLAWPKEPCPDHARMTALS
jgi:DNA-binding response OmpR family regulator